MTDFFKIHVLNPDLERIRNNPALDWIQSTNERTGEVKQYTAKFNGLTFQIIGRYLNVSGSLHKFWNSINGRGEQNYNDFSFSDLTDAIIDFCNRFELAPDSCIVENFEFGVNIRPPIPTGEILRSLINHKGKPFNRTRRGNMNFLECEHGQYFVKIYDKGLQYDQGNLLRFEIKTRKMDFVKTAKVKYLSDLLNPDTLKRLGMILTANFGELLFFDNTIPDAGINARDRLILTQGQNPAFWTDYKHTNPDNYFKKRNRFTELVKEYGTHDIQELTVPLIVQKWNELLTSDSQTLQELTGGVKRDFTGIDTSNIGSNPVTSDPWQPVPDQVTGKGAEVNDTDAGTPPRRYCLSCGADITHQRPGSKFCGAKYVGYSQAHRCRNRDSNPRNRIKYMKEKEKSEPTLFDIFPFIVDRRSSTRARYET